LFTPFIPLWSIGEEYNNPFTVPGYTLFTNPTDFSYKDINRDFYEDVKKLFRIRWQYKDIFANNTESTIKDANICGVIVDGGEEVQSYARYKDNKAIVVVPNMNSNKATRFTVYTPFADTNLSGYESYKITDLLTDKVIAKGTASKLTKFSVNIPYEHQGIYLIEGIGEKTVIKNTDDSEPEEITKYIYNTSEEKEEEKEPLTEKTEEKEEVEDENKLALKPDSKKEEPNQSKAWIWISVSLAAAVLAAAAVTAKIIIKKKKH